MSNLAKPVGPGSTLLTEQPKRQRGRPRKQPQEPMEPLPPKKPRGRPRGTKKLSAKSGQVGQGAGNQDAGKQNESSRVHTSAEKKPRGRPRKWLVVQEEEYTKACVQESSNPSSNICPTTEDMYQLNSWHRSEEIHCREGSLWRGTSGKSCHRSNRTTELRRQLNTSPAVVQQQPAC